MPGTVFYTEIIDGVIVAIPKKRGKGFMKSPVSHHVNDLSVFVSGIETSLDCFSDGLGLNVCSDHLNDMTWEQVVSDIAEFSGFSKIQKVNFSEYEKLFDNSK